MKKKEKWKLRHENATYMKKRRKREEYVEVCCVWSSDVSAVYFTFGHCSISSDSLVSLIIGCTRSKKSFSSISVPLSNFSLSYNVLLFANHVAFGSFPLQRAIHVFRVDYFQMADAKYMSCWFHSVSSTLWLMVFIWERAVFVRDLFIDHIIFNNSVSFWTSAL